MPPNAKQEAQNSSYSRASKQNPVRGDGRSNLLEHNFHFVPSQFGKKRYL
jgi:hypothetical protein